MSKNVYFQQNITAIHRFVQAVFGIFTLYVGYRFYLFYNWTMDQGEYVARPPAVEGFLPISALLSLKRLIISGEFDPIHPAGLVIFIAALTIGLLARKGFCGWICPVGFTSHLAQWLGGKLKILLTLPVWLNYTLSSTKYLLLGFFLYIIGWKMDVTAITSFLETPYNLAADAKMLQFFLAPSSLALAIMIFLAAISCVIPNFWCRFLCPYGALLGLLAFFSPLQINRNPDNCIDCRKCNRQCPGGIKVSRKETVRSPECIGCLECVAACPKENCLTVQGPGRKKRDARLIPLVAVMLFLGFWFTARLGDHWQSKVPPDTFKQMYQLAERLSHPRY
ncbi:MAG: 4Fe-4S binding protein [Desulfobulbaceae bacterium]|nr:4Fe-4S binding protein [Desulfobulbaceae bacterium]